MLGLAPRLPITITLLTAMTTNLLVRLRPLPDSSGRACVLCFHHAKIFRAALSQKLEGRAQISGTRERSGRQAVPEQRGPKGWRGVLAQRPPPNRGHAFGFENDCRDWLSLGSASPRALRFGPGARMIGKAGTEMRRMRRCRDQSNPTSITTFGRNV